MKKPSMGAVSTHKKQSGMQNRRQQPTSAQYSSLPPLNEHQQANPPEPSRRDAEEHAEDEAAILKQIEMLQKKLGDK